MKAVIQRVSHASVDVDGKTVGSCERGYLILLGVAEGDTEAEAEMLCRKILQLRIFPDEAGKMNRSIKDIDGEMLVISQFTLLANDRHGNRPDFLESAKPEEANRLYEYFKKHWFSLNVAFSSWVYAFYYCFANDFFGKCFCLI